MHLIFSKSSSDSFSGPFLCTMTSYMFCLNFEVFLNMKSTYKWIKSNNISLFVFFFLIKIQSSWNRPVFNLTLRSHVIMLNNVVVLYYWALEEFGYLCMLHIEDIYALWIEDLQEVFQIKTCKWEQLFRECQIKRTTPDFSWSSHKVNGCSGHVQGVWGWHGGLLERRGRGAHGLGGAGRVVLGLGGELCRGEAGPGERLRQEAAMWRTSGGGLHILVASSSENLPLLIKSGGLGKEQRRRLFGQWGWNLWKHGHRFPVAPLGRRCRSCKVYFHTTLTGRSTKHRRTSQPECNRL